MMITGSPLSPLPASAPVVVHCKKNGWTSRSGNARSLGTTVEDNEIPAAVAGISKGSYYSVPIT